MTVAMVQSRYCPFKNDSWCLGQDLNQQPAKWKSTVLLPYQPAQYLQVMIPRLSVIAHVQYKNRHFYIYY
jgi:hypothetical protein